MKDSGPDEKGFRIIELTEGEIEALIEESIRSKFNVGKDHDLNCLLFQLNGKKGCTVSFFPRRAGVK